jgi:phospholipid/cholesterol/gamma-HCH transport system substrate-binding protein
MKKNNTSVGVFVAVAILLFGIGLFLIGDQHKAFRRKADFYVEFTNLDGIPKGAKVRVNGMDGGQVQEVMIPSSPTQKFRLKLTLDDRLHGLIRND